MAMDIGDAKLTLKVEGEEKVNAALNNVGKSVENMSKKFKMAGAAITAIGVAMVVTLTKMVTSYAEAGDQVAKMAQRTGVSTEELSRLRFMAERSGTSIEGLEKGLIKMSKTLYDAREGLSTATRALENLGLNLEDLEAVSPEERFYAIATALADIEDPGDRAALAMEVFGRAGTKLLPMLEGGREGIAALRGEAEKFAPIFSEEAAGGCAAFNDAITNLKASLGTLIAEFTEKILPTITDFITKVTEIISKVIEWAKEHPKLTKALGTFSLILTGLTVTGGPMLLFIGFLPQIKTGLLMVSGCLTKTLIPALIRAASAFIIFLSTMGPAGWATIAAGAAAAAAAIAAIMATVGVGEEAIATPTPEAYEKAAEFCREHPEAPTCKDLKAKGLISMRYGGIVPGPLGAPVPIMAHGGEPFGGIGARMQSREVNVHIHGDFMGDEMSLREFGRKLQEVLREEERRTAFSGINSGYYWGGSHI